MELLVHSTIVNDLLCYYTARDTDKHLKIVCKMTCIVKWMSNEPVEIFRTKMDKHMPQHTIRRGYLSMLKKPASVA